jgi:NAD(P)-dependent dehydrogenase (short-subunit alcohol dehydrogenase family)
MMSKWTIKDMPSQAGRVAVVTGTGGLGLEDAVALARAGAEVIIAGRSATKGADAVARVRREVRNAKVKFEAIDLASLKSVAAFAERIAASHDHIDLLINNAAVMVPPKRQLTEDGFELQLGTNYLGHFALTARLMPLLRKGRNPRVVSLSSVAARAGQIHFDDMQFENYHPMNAYGQSKIACLMFAFELQRRSQAGRWGVTSVAAHPGVSRTDLLLNAPGEGSAQAWMRTNLWFLFQPAAQGALPTLFAATAPEAEGGVYYGPNGIAEIRGKHPSKSRVPPQAEDRAVAQKLWWLSEELTGVKFPE